MKKTIIIIPLTNSITKDELLGFYTILKKIPEHVIFCISICTKHNGFDTIKKLQSEFQKKIIIIPLFNKRSNTQIIIQAHQSFLNHTNIEYFASYNFRSLPNINHLYNKIDTIINNPNLNVIFCERSFNTKTSIISKLITHALNFNFNDYCICTNVINKTVARHVYNECNIKNRLLFKIYFVVKLYSLFGKEQIKLSIY